MRSLRPYFHLSYGCRCNLRCFYCYERLDARFDTFDDAESIGEQIRAGRRCGYDTIAFASGELVLHPAWRDLVGMARAEGFGEIQLVTNLTLLDETTVAELAAAGIDLVAGTVAARTDEDALVLAGAPKTFSKQLDAVRWLGDHPSVTFVPHLMASASLTEHLLPTFEALHAAYGRAIPVAMISAIEPIVSAMRDHSQFVDAGTLDWEATLASFDARGTRVVTQNVPACLLGRYAHRSWWLERRVGRIRAGWPAETWQRTFVAEQERLLRRGEYDSGCALGGACQNVEWLDCRGVLAEGTDIRTVTERVLDEHGIAPAETLVAQIVRELEAMVTADRPWPGG